MTDEEASHLGDCLDNWINGMSEARDKTIQDPNLATPDDLLQAVQGIDQMFNVASRLRARLDSDGAEIEDETVMTVLSEEET